MQKIGTWWNDPTIDMFEIGGTVYALHGWNGESWTESWICSGERFMDASTEAYDVWPVYKQIADDQFENVGYEVR